uniref:WLM domain-containing protein n=1 Tax=viral metagenome TaxID=1070528 RepID=A0A6C0EI97_9ZZZZ
MNEFVNIVIITIIIISLYIYYESKYSDLEYVKSTIDNEMYLVRNRPDKQKASNILAKIKKKLTELVKTLEITEGNKEKVQRLIQKYNPRRISESFSGSNTTSYSINKGEKIVFCIRTKDSDEKLIKFNTIMFVAIHELAHVMTLSIGHTDEFWDNMKYLLKHAIKHGIYKKQDFRKKPEKYCGTTITDSPLQ